MQLPPDRFDRSTDFAAALAAYEAEPPVRVLFDNGAGGTPGAPVAGFEASFTPVAAADGRAPRAWYLRPAARSRRRRRPPATATPTASRYDPAAFPRTSTSQSSGEDFFDAQPAYDWKPLPDGKAVAYVTEPLGDRHVVLGPGSVDLWLRSTRATPTSR